MHVFMSRHAEPEEWLQNQDERAVGLHKTDEKQQIAGKH